MVNLSKGGGVSVDLAGNPSSISLTRVLQLLCEDPKTGTLRIRRSDQEEGLNRCLDFTGSRKQVPGKSLVEKSAIGEEILAHNGSEQIEDLLCQLMTW